MPLVKGSESSHILITGTTGSGKTTCMNILLPQIRTKNRSAIIIDYNGQMTEKYFNKARGDIIIAEGEYVWDFWEDIKDEDNLCIIADTLFADKGNNYDEMWNNASKQFFKDSVRLIAKEANPTIKALYELLATKSLLEVHIMLENTASSSMLDPGNERTAMSLRTNTIAFIGWMENFQESDNKFSITQWGNNAEFQKGGWIFLRASPKQRASLKSLHSVLLDLFINQIMDLGEDL
ncbi:MAG UNVERIFIED_CONTAM: type IV secretion system DNA-binding domain-containing protein [Rickettsiaceae bacterium]|jgi:hypothetical protein